MYFILLIAVLVLFFALPLHSRFYTILCRFYKNVSQRRGMLVRGMLVGEKRQKKRNDSAC